MSGPLSLPTEILQEIGSMVGKDLRKLRAVNRRLQLALEPLYFQGMKIHPGKSGSQLKALINESTRAAAYVQHLEISREGYGTEPEDVALYLEPALCKFKTLRSLKWHISFQSIRPLENMVNHCVVECLGPLQSLKALEIVASANLNSSYAASDLALGGFRNLEEFSIRISSHSPSLLTDIVQEVISANTSHLTTLGLVAEAPSSIDLEQVLPVSMPLLRLRHLSLKWYDISGMQSMLPHLQSLQSLKLLNNSPGSSADIWVTLLAAKLWIPNLEVSKVDSSLLEYLASFSTLEHILIDSDEDSTESYEQHVQKLLADVLPKHSSSSIILRHAQWAFLWPLVCGKLVDLNRCTELTVDIPLSDIKYRGGDILASLLDYTDELPRLQCLTLKISDIPIGTDATLNAKIRVLSTITHVRTAQKSTKSASQCSGYIIQIQCAKLHFNQILEYYNTMPINPLYIVGGTVITVALTPVAGPAVLGLAGFTKAGVAAGFTNSVLGAASLGAGIQATIGNVAAGSLFAGAMSAGATGTIPVIGHVISAGIGAGAGAIVGATRSANESPM
ncbi:hypothetical protein GYMLUDRAFT_246206 [Collybiopsis luxurians FD-317 M1]|uniref:Unplaced genomic scaffold GYMLUscaffold_38, whole genome shotgun sequence n=1 Tax=Collybiopsis luxurians FD-317 M1 TaxID=944289 RepID=A0A0D0CIM5_9AGAR|nr:hypothetical protein GYMLUDRAFT_246206 [Collybiopsis luxurians FD-317 M1]